MKGYLGEEGRGGDGAEAWKKAEGGCCNTATYSTGAGGVVMERERG